MKMSARIGTVTAGIGVIFAGSLVAPQTASAYGISQCRVLATTARTSFSVSCKGSFLDSDVYRARVYCNGSLVHVGWQVTPILGGWGPSSTVTCSSGWNSATYETGD